MERPHVCSHLQFIVEGELERGNRIESIAEEAFDRCDLLVIFAGPFGAYYEESVPRDVQMDIKTDPHYPVGKSFFCTTHRQALFAPQEHRR